LIERRPLGLRVGTTRNLELHQPDRRAELIAQHEITIYVAASGHARQQIGRERRAPYPLADLIGYRGAIEIRHRKTVHGPRRKTAHAVDHRGRERAGERNPTLRLASAGAVEHRADREQRRPARALDDAADPIAHRIQLA
jgi:hypothetical protein